MNERRVRCPGQRALYLVVQYTGVRLEVGYGVKDADALMVPATRAVLKAAM